MVVMTTQFKNGLCGVCPAGCRVIVGIEDGKLISMKPDQSQGHGLLCRRGKFAPQIVYSKNRLKTPMKRIGAKGSYNFEPISWDEAYELIVKNLNKIKKESGPEALCVYTGRGAFEQSLCDMYQPKGVTVSSASNVLFKFGSPNTTGVGALCYVAFAMIAPHVTMGRMQNNINFNYEKADILIIWGANPDTDSPPLKMFYLKEAQKRGADIISIDPRRTESIQKTNGQWVPIRPGTDCALALSMIQILIEKDLYDKNFVQNWCHGFEELREYVKEFKPEIASKITGVPKESIINLAIRLAKSNGACPVMYTGLEYSNSGVQAIRAVYILFALAGHLDVPGGICLKMKDSSFPINKSCNVKNPDIDRAIGRDIYPLYSLYRDEFHASYILNSVLKGDPYHIRGLIIQGASIITSWPQPPLWRKVFSKLDFIVCIDRQLTADAAYADILLPATTMFENNSYHIYRAAFRLRERLIEPLGEARNDYLIMAELAKHLGYGDQFPQTEEEMIRLALKGSGFSLEDVKSAGGTVRIELPHMKYKKWEKGLLRADKKNGFDTPTGKYEIWSTILEKYGYEPLPKFVEPTESPIRLPDLAKEYPLVFNSGARTHTDFRTQHHGIPEILNKNPTPSIEINTNDAKVRNIKTGDIVKVKTLRGCVKFRAIVTDNIVQGAIECNMGGGTPVGPKEWNEWNVNELTDASNVDPISGFPVYKALLCEVELTID